MKTNEIVSFPSFFGRGKDLTKSFLQNADEFFTDLFPVKGWPRTNVTKTNNGYAIEVSAPGYNKKEVEISLENDTLTISFEKKENKENLDHQEFSYNCSSRSYKLPEHCDVENIKTTMENGILVVNIPNKAATKNPERKLIPVE